MRRLRIAGVDPDPYAERRRRRRFGMLTCCILKSPQHRSASGAHARTTSTSVIQTSCDKRAPSTVALRGKRANRFIRNSPPMSRSILLLFFSCFSLLAFAIKFYTTPFPTEAKLKVSVRTCVKKPDGTSPTSVKIAIVLKCVTFRRNISHRFLI